MRAWLWTLALCLGLASAGAGAAEPPRIALVHERAADERALGRLRAELSSLGLEVVDVVVRETSGAPLDESARSVGAFAAVHVVPRRGGVEVWVADRKSGGTLVRERVIGPGGAFDDVLALQAAELVRATLVDLGLAPKPAAENTEPAPENPPPPSPRPVPLPGKDDPRPSLEIGPALSADPGGLGPALHAFVGARYRATRALGLDAWSALPLTPATVEEPEGRADVRALLFGVGASAWPFAPGSDFQLALAGGTGLAHLTIDGRARPPLLARAEATTAALVFSRLSIAQRLGSRVGLGASGFVAVAFPRPAVRFDAREVAEWGRPLVLGVLACDVALD